MKTANNHGRGKYKRDNKTKKRDTKLSKELSNILRHQALKFGLHVRSDGFVKLTDILSLKPDKRFDFSSTSLADVQRVVEYNDKNRFKLQLEGDELFIRANQGHTINCIDEEELLRRVICPSEVPVCVHGTYWKAWQLIKASGLSKMKRNHIHFAVGLPDSDGVISGMRGNVELIISINTEKAMEDGISFFVSENLVILSSGIDGTIPPKYFQEVVEVSSGEVIFRGEDGSTSPSIQTTQEKQEASPSANASPSVSSQETGDARAPTTQ
jgi:2'-phosphotransferase